MPATCPWRPNAMRFRARAEVTGRARSADKGGGAVEFVDERVELGEDLYQAAHAAALLVGQLVEARERRADVADRVAGGGGERLRVALVPVGRVARRHDVLDLGDESLDSLRV